MSIWRDKLNTGRGCHCCGASKIRIELPSGALVCPTCDRWPKREEKVGT